jgi:hypothetical protein
VALALGVRVIPFTYLLSPGWGILYLYIRIVAGFTHSMFSVEAPEVIDRLVTGGMGRIGILCFVFIILHSAASPGPPPVEKTG